MTIGVLISGLINAVPEIIIWIIAVVLSSVLLRRNGGMTARLLVIGSSLLLVTAVISIGLSGFVVYLLAERDFSSVNISIIMSSINLFLGLIKLAGAILIFIGVWKKFNEKPGIITEQ